MQTPADLQTPPTTHATEDLLANAARFQAGLSQALAWASSGAAVTQAAASLAGEVLGVVRGMHGTISRAPLPLAQVPEGQPRGITRLVYDCIETGFTGTETALATLANALPAAELNSAGWIQTQAAINGVLGDRLYATGNRLAIPMQRTRAQGEGRRLVLFIHGLCMSELGWAGQAHLALVDDLLSTGHRVEYLRYNTGRHISDNGADLAALLAHAIDSGEFEQISLIGHSMGGLVMRSALAQADHAAPWVQAIKHCVYLGTPHHGAPLERLGNHANRLLKVSPYTAPFMRLGNIRSMGIQDLRHGCITESDWAARESHDDINDYRDLPPLPEHITHTLVAATRSTVMPENPNEALDDYLVPVESALGICAHNLRTLDAPRLMRHSLHDSHHLHMLSGQAYQRIIREAVQAKI